MRNEAVNSSVQRRQEDPQQRRSTPARAAQERPAARRAPQRTQESAPPARSRSAEPSRNGGPRRREPEVYDFNYQKKQAARRARIRRNRIILLSGLLLVVALIVGGRMAIVLGSGLNTFYEGVSVDGLRLNGYSQEEALTLLSQHNSSRIESMALTFRFGEQEWTISPTQLGITPDISEQIELAWACGREGNIFERQAQISALKHTPYEGKTTLAYSSAALMEQLQAIKKSIDLPAKNASVDFDTSRQEMFYIVPEEEGREVSLEALHLQAAQMLGGGKGGVISITPEPVAPTIYENDLRLSTNIIKRVTTDLGSSTAERVHNIKLALSKFDGMIIMPGEEVSFNQTTGPRSLEAGYKNAGVILDDEIVDGPGGGVCQASTTMYQALVRSGIQVTNRSKHSLPVSYVEKGTDAAVAYDYKDLAFKNNTDGPIYLHCTVSGSTVGVTVYGRSLEDGMSIKIVSDVLETVAAPEPEILPDTTGQYVKYTDEVHEKKKSRDGYRVKTYAVWEKDGKEVKREQLTSDYYKEVKGVQYVGVTVRPQESPVSANPNGSITDIGNND